MSRFDTPKEFITEYQRFQERERRTALFREAWSENQKKIVLESESGIPASEVEDNKDPFTRLKKYVVDVLDVDVETHPWSNEYHPSSEGKRSEMRVPPNFLELFHELCHYLQSTPEACEAYNFDLDKVEPLVKAKAEFQARILEVALFILAGKISVDDNWTIGKKIRSNAIPYLQLPPCKVPAGNRLLAILREAPEVFSRFDGFDKTV